MNKEERILKYNNFMRGKGGIPAKILDKLGFFDAPASTKYHGAYEGGLFDHSLAVAEELVNLTERLGLTWSSANSPYIVGMYHDLCKCDEYVWDEESVSFKFNRSKLVPGHGEKSVIIVQRHLILTEEEIVTIRWHMGAFDDEKMWGYYGEAIENFPNVLYTHMADMIASKIRGV